MMTMGAARIQYSLLTAILVTMGAGGIVWMNMDEHGPFLAHVTTISPASVDYYYWYGRGWPFLYQETRFGNVLGGPHSVCRWSEKRDGTVYDHGVWDFGAADLDPANGPPALDSLRRAWEIPVHYCGLAGIAVNALVGLGALVLLGCISEFLVRRHRRSTQQSLASVSPAESAHSDSEQVPSDRRGK
jgi:hypothetical protein